MKKRVVVIHTFLYSVEDLKKLFKEKLPEVEMINIVDDSLLQESLSNKGMTRAVVKRITQYALIAESMGADAILNQCSSVGEAVDIVKKLISIPYVKVDEPMAREAVQRGHKIGIVATAISTVGPSARLVENVAKRVGKAVVVKDYFAAGAYEALLQENDRDNHNKILIKTIEKASSENDVIVLAQGSMYHLLPLLAHIKKPILSSLESGVEQLRNILNLDK